MFKALNNRLVAQQELNSATTTTSSSISSVSKRRLILKIGTQTKVQCSLKRHLAPRTVGIIMRSLPLEGHAHTMGKGIVYFEAPIDSGTERKRTEFKKGDIAFLPSAGSICFFVHDTSSSKIMTPIGVLEDNDKVVEALGDVKQGSVMRLYEELEETG